MHARQCQCALRAAMMCLYPRVCAHSTHSITTQHPYRQLLYLVHRPRAFTSLNCSSTAFLSSACAPQVSLSPQRSLNSSRKNAMSTAVRPAVSRSGGVEGAHVPRAAGQSLTHQRCELRDMWRHELPRQSMAPGDFYHTKHCTFVASHSIVYYKRVTVHGHSRPKRLGI